LSDYQLAFSTLVSGVLLIVLDRALIVFPSLIVFAGGHLAWHGIATAWHGMAWLGLYRGAKEGKHDTAGSEAVCGVCGFVRFSAETRPEAERQVSI
jgi:hypothetical protein